MSQRMDLILGSVASLIGLFGWGYSLFAPNYCRGRTTMKRKRYRHPYTIRKSPGRSPLHDDLEASSEHDSD